MATKSETYITRSIIKYIKKVGGDAFHVHGSMFQRNGEPDISGDMPYGKTYLKLKLEVKTPKGKPTKIQIERLKSYHTRGYVAGIVSSTSDLIELIYVYSRFYEFGQNLEPFSALYTETTGKPDYGIYDKSTNAITYGLNDRLLL